MKNIIRGSLTIISIFLILIMAMGMVWASQEDSISPKISVDNNVQVVESLSDSGDGKHFEDVQKQIDNAKDGDEIILNGVEYTPFNRDIETNTPIVVYKSLNITGVGDKTVFNAWGSDGIFFIDHAKYVVFKNITFIGSIGLSAVSISNANVDFVDCVFDLNQGSVGSALNVYADEKDITLNVLDSTFKNNGAGLGAAGVGGAIALSQYDYAITTNIKNTYFFNNIALRGGAIYIPGYDNKKSYLNIDNVTFEDNKLTLQNIDYVEISGCDIGFWGAYNYVVNITNSRFIDSYDDENPYALSLLLLGSENNFVNNTFSNSKISFEKTDATFEDCSFQNVSIEFYNDPTEDYLQESGSAPKSANLNYKISNCTFLDSSMVVGSGFIENVNFLNSSIYKNSENDLKLENCNFTKQSMIKAFSNVEVSNSQFADNSNIKFDAIDVKIDVSKISAVTYNSAKKLSIVPRDATTGEVFTDLKVKIKVSGSKSSKTYYVTTDKKGRANLVLDTRFAVGTYTMEISSSDSKYVFTAVKKTIKVTKAKTTIKAPKITAKVKSSKYFRATVKDKTTKKVVKNVKVKIKVGKKTFIVKTNSKGVAQLNTKSLSVGSYKVVISSGNSNYEMSAKSTILIKR